MSMSDVSLGERECPIIPLHEVADPVHFFALALNVNANGGAGEGEKS